MRQYQLTRSHVWLLATCLAALAGCASTPKLESPKVTLISFSMMSADVFSQQFRVKLHVDNPNTIALPVKTIEYKLFLEGDSFSDGTTAAPFVVPASGSTEFDVIVNAHFGSSFGRLLSRINGDNRSTIRYDIAGKINLDKSFGPTLNFQQSGMVQLSKM
jgi:LEA14-like dessication related protein